MVELVYTVGMSNIASQAGQKFCIVIIVMVVNWVFLVLSVIWVEIWQFVESWLLQVSGMRFGGVEILRQGQTKLR